MALVPFKVNGPSATLGTEERLVQLPLDQPFLTLRVQQRPRESGAMRALAAAGEERQTPAAAQALTLTDPQHPPASRTPSKEQQHAAAAAASAGRARPELRNVGLVIWQSSIVLADLLLRRPPYGQGSWPGVSVLELGCGPGVVGMALALAGARVVMTDLPHVTPLTRVNVEGNCGHAACGVPRVVDHAWGGDAAPLLAALAARGAGAGGDGGVQRAGTGGAAAAAAAAAAPGADGLPAAGQAAGVGAAAAAAAVAVQPGAAAAAAAAGFDLIVAADCVYEPPFYADLLSTLRAVAAPHACVVMAHRMRGLGEAGFPAAAQAAGWAVEQLPPHLLHQEFRDGSYLVLRLAWLG